MDARLAAERVDLQTRVFGNRRQPRPLRIGARLQERVFGKGRAGLVGFRQIREVEEREKPGSSVSKAIVRPQWKKAMRMTKRITGWSPTYVRPCFKFEK